MILKLMVLFLPWPLKRWALQKFFGYRIDRSARIGLAWIYPRKLLMGKNARIDHFTVALHLDCIEMANHAFIGRSNWITGHPVVSAEHFTHQKERRPQLIIGEHSAITKKHHLDCTHEIRIGKFCTIAGYESQFLTHSIDIYLARQHSEPIAIGDYCFVGTRCLILGGAKLPSQSVLAAGAVLNKAYETTFTVYGGVPAKPIKEIPKDALYFSRTTGFIK